MIGVIAEAAQRDVIKEFFELFKTPWEFYRRDHSYDVLICSGERPCDAAAKLWIIYADRNLRFDCENDLISGEPCSPRIVSYKGQRFPIYGQSIGFPRNLTPTLADENSHEDIAYVDRSSEEIIVRVGYDLFEEVRKLLTLGQPAANAQMPALELHIAFLRDLITESGLTLVEIPPVPEGYRFIVCLTHDVDHPSIRKHKFDHTALGFWYRAVFRSFQQLLSRRMSLRSLMRNWAAALKLPFVYLHLAEDFWRNFDDRYLELEEGAPSTFFVIPFKGHSGVHSNGPTPPSFRAARYRAADLSNTLEKLIGAGCEVGLHGIDTWCDSERGRAELDEIRRLTGSAQIGVRMHWLYYEERSPMTVEAAGATYDSTIGYNETVGYHAGTTQVYKPLQATQLLELPLHAMDTALFYPAYLGLSPRQAMTVLGQLVDNAVQFGGCFTVNWHDRSLAPERLWDACYRDLVRGLKSSGAWFSTASEAVSWFQKRRSVVFETGSIESDAVQARVSARIGDDLPSLRLRIYKPRELHTD